MPDWQQPFCIASLCRDNLRHAGLPDEVIETLTNEDMREIAAPMSDLYSDNGYWEDMALCAQHFLDKKKGGRDETPPRTA